MFDLTSLRRRAGRDMIGLKSEIDNLFNRFFDIDSPISREFLKEGDWAPRVDVSEGDKHISVNADIPGCDAKDIEVTLDGRILTIKGEKNTRKKRRIKTTFGWNEHMVIFPGRWNCRPMCTKRRLKHRTKKAS